MRERRWAPLCGHRGVMLGEGDHPDATGAPAYARTRASTRTNVASSEVGARQAARGPRTVVGSSPRGPRGLKITARTSSKKCHKRRKKCHLLASTHQLLQRPRDAKASFDTIVTHSRRRWGWMVGRRLLGNEALFHH